MATEKQPAPALSGIQVTDKIAQFENLINFKNAPHIQRLITLPHHTIFLDAGNQGGKTASVAYNYVLRILGIHPIPEKNKLSKSIRCLSSSLPEPSADPEEQDNTQYLEFKKLLPPEAILKDITHRSSSMVVAGHLGRHFIEFRSTKQELQDTGKVQRSSLWEDEESPKQYREESRIRLNNPPGLKPEDRGLVGDEIITLTPVNGLSYLYDDVFLRASYFWRSPTICRELNLPEEEYNKAGSPNIAVIQLATDDNPVLSKEGIDVILDGIDPNVDKDLYELRRFGVFKQITGRVHKTYNPQICYIDYRTYFPDDIPYEWTHSRGVDYHESRIPWSVGWLSVSPDDEWFLWQEMHPSIDGPKAMNTYEIARSIARKSGDYYYICNLIDPLANKKQANTLMSTTDDLNRHFHNIRRDHGLGTPTFWQGWDTKDTKGRNEIRRRFKNATMVGKPFNNKIQEKGKAISLPTLWICNTCVNFHKSIQRWSYGEWQTTQTKQVNDPKSQPQQRFSHDNMVLECLAKDHRILFAGKHHGVVTQGYRKRSITGR